MSFEARVEIEGYIFRGEQTIVTDNPEIALEAIVQGLVVNSLQEFKNSKQVVLKITCFGFSIFGFWEGQGDGSGEGLGHGCGHELGFHHPILFGEFDSSPYQRFLDLSRT